MNKVRRILLLLMVSGVIGANLEDVATVEKIFQWQAPVIQIYQRYDVNNDGEIVTAKENTLRVVSADGKLVGEWKGYSPNRIYWVGKEVYFSSYGGVTDKAVWRRWRPQTGEVTLLKTPDVDEAIPVCDPPHWIYLDRPTWFLDGHILKVFSENRGDTPLVAFTTDGKSCRVSVTFGDSFVLIILDENGAIRKRWQFKKTEVETWGISGLSYAAKVVPLARKWVLLPWLAVFDPDRPKTSLTRLIPGLRGSESTFVHGDNWVALPSEPVGMGGGQSWILCEESGDCKEVAVPITQGKRNFVGFRYSFLGRVRSVACAEFQTDSVPTPYPDSPILVSCWNPRTGVINRYGREPGNLELNRFSIAAPLNSDRWLMGVPPKIFDFSAKKAVPLKVDPAHQIIAFFGINRRIGVVAQGANEQRWQNRLGRVDGDKITWIAEWPNKELTPSIATGPRAAERNSGGPSRPNDWATDSTNPPPGAFPVGITQKGEAVLILPWTDLTTDITRSSGLWLYIVPVPKRWFLGHASPIHLFLGEFFPYLPPAMESVQYLQAPLGPFLDDQDRLWLVGVRPSFGDRSGRPSGTSPEIWVINVRSARVVVRLDVSQPGSAQVLRPPLQKKNPPPPGSFQPAQEFGFAPWQGWSNYPASFVRPVPGTDSFVLMRPSPYNTIEVIDFRGRLLRSYNCGKLCADARGWFVFSENEWFAISGDALYHITLPRRFQKVPNR